MPTPDQVSMEKDVDPSPVCKGKYVEPIPVSMAKEIRRQCESVVYLSEVKLKRSNFCAKLTQQMF